MSFLELLSIFGGLAGLISLILTTTWAIRDRRRAALEDGRQGASGVSARLEDETYDRTDYGWGFAGRDIYVRNDGPLPITIKGIRLGPGATWFDVENVDVLRPHWPQKMRIPEGRLDKRFLASGEEVKVRVPTPDEMPDPIDDPNLEHPEVDFIDHSGRHWSLCDANLVQLSPDVDPYSPREKRRAWFERRRWFRPVERWLRLQAVRRTSRHPWRPSRLVLLADRLWGWLPGPGIAGTFPMNLPSSWKFQDLVMPQDELHEYLQTGHRRRPARRLPAPPDAGADKAESEGGGQVE